MREGGRDSVWVKLLCWGELWEERVCVCVCVCVGGDDVYRCCKCLLSTVLVCVLIPRVCPLL